MISEVLAQIDLVGGTGLALLGAAIAVGIAGISSAIGAALVGALGARVVAEDQRKFSSALLFQALPQTQGVYGFLIAILILIGTGLITGYTDISLPQGLGALGAGLAVGLAAISAIGQGIAAAAGLGASSEDKRTFGKAILFSVLPETQALYGFLVAILILVGIGILGDSDVSLTIGQGWAMIGAGLAIGLAGVSAIGQGMAAASGIGALLERAKSFGKSIVFAVLPETQALYGFIIAVLILIGFGVIGTSSVVLPASVSLFAVGAGLAVGLAAVSAIGQGIVAAKGASAVGKNDKLFGKAILFSVLPETQALYGFLIAILLLVGGGILTGVSTTFEFSVGVLALGAGLAVGLAAISAVGQGIAAASGISALIENTRSFGKSLLFSVLPETQALYGFLIAVLLLVGGGILGGVSNTIPLSTSLLGIGAGLAVGLAGVSAIGQGIAAARGASHAASSPKNFGKYILFAALPETQALYGFLIAVLLLVGSGIIGSPSPHLTVGVGMLGIGAGLAVGLSAVSALGQGHVASNSISAITRKPGLFGKAILFSALPETQALYGFLIAILLLVGSGLLGGVVQPLDLGVGVIGISAGLAVGLAAVSAIGQGLVASSGVHAVAEKPSVFGKAILFSALPETQALYGFLIAILLLVGSGLLGGLAPSVALGTGLVALGASLSVGLAAISAIGQGLVASSGIASIVQKPKIFGKAILFSALPETQALYGFLIAILLLVGSGILGGLLQNIGLGTGTLALGAGLAVGLAGVSAIGQGLVASSGLTATSSQERVFGRAVLFSALPETQALYGFLIAILLLVGGGIIGVMGQQITVGIGLVGIGAGLAVGLAAVSAIGQGIVASSAIRAVAEKMKIFGKAILFSVLPETQALYGFLIAVLLLVGSGLLGSTILQVPLGIGLISVGVGLSVGLAAISAVGQGITASSGIAATTDNEKMFGRSILFSVFPETQALYGLIIAILTMTGVGLLGGVEKTISVVVGLGGMGIGAAVGIAAVSALGQGIIAAAGISATVRDTRAMGKSIVFAVIPETYAIFGLLIAMLALIGLGIL